MPIELNDNLYFIGMVKHLTNLHAVLIVNMQIFQIKILNEINFLLIIISILIQSKIFFHSP